MSLIAMPFLLVNLGCEMLYILDQRLKAQSIAEDKSCRVLQDVVRSMFDTAYVDRLFTPQEVYSISNTRKIFEKLAHSSIMRLSESSMDKLFDLMAMGVKYQLYCASRLEQMLEVTLLHLKTIRSLMDPISDSNIISLIKYVEAKMKQTYGTMSMGQLHLLRQTLQRFFLDKRVKVSLFLQEGIQSSSGRLILPSPNADRVGTVTLFLPSGAVKHQDKVKLKSQQIEACEFFMHPAPLGTNLYSKDDRAPVRPPTRQFDTVAPTGPSSVSGGGSFSAAGESGAASFSRSMSTSSAGGHTYAEDMAEKGGKDARKELDLLTTLLVIPSKSQQSDNFKLNLFGDDDGLGSSNGRSGSSGGGAVLMFGARGKNDEYRKQAGLASMMKGLDVSEKPGGTADDDLLDLMDGA